MNGPNKAALAAADNVHAEWIKASGITTATTLTGIGTMSIIPSIALALDAFAQQARDKALEEAAQLAHALWPNEDAGYAIRALKSKPAEEPTP